VATRTIEENILMEVRANAALGLETPVTFIAEPEPEPLFCPIISADDHALEPDDLFEGRVPARLRDRAPRVDYDEAGYPWWVIDGRPTPLLLVNGGSGRTMSEWGTVPARFTEFRDGVRDSTRRLHDMDLCGVWASLCFGSLVWGFAGTRLSTYSDPEVGLACLRAYNEWMLEEWCGAAPERFIPCQLPWLADPAVAAEEIVRNAEHGFRSVSFSENPEGLGFPNIYDSYWDPFLSACEDTETVVNLHVGSSGTTSPVCSSSHSLVTTALFPVSGLQAMIDWTISGVLIRHPRLTVALSEAGASWVPMALERLGRAQRQSESVGHRAVEWPDGSPTFTEIAHRNFVYTSIEDDSAFRQLDLIGEDRVMVETDYPHFDSTWPECQAMIRHELSHLPPATVRKVCYENAARIYRHPLPPAELVARSEIAHTEHGGQP
jgi:predicted TIM-barrel fold metal-dependent hydrolase